MPHRYQIPGLRTCLSICLLLSVSWLFACDAPLSPQSFNPTLTTVSLSWITGGPGVTGTDLLVLPRNATPPEPGDAPTYESVSGNIFTLQNLQPGTAFDVYLRGRCGNTFSEYVLLKTHTAIDNTDACGLLLPVPDNACLDFPIVVNNAPGSELGTDAFLSSVEIVLAHEWDADLDIWLLSPGGNLLELSTDNGSGLNNYGNPDDPLCEQTTTFMSAAVVSACNTPKVTEGEAPFIGTFLPEGDFADLHDGTTDPNGTWTLRLCDDAPDSTGYLAAVRLNFVGNICPIPSDAVVSTIDSTSLVLNWNANGDCSSTVIEYGPVGFVPGTTGLKNEGDSVIFAGCPPWTIGGLDPGTEYDFYIRSFCGGNSFSGNSCAVSAETTCAPGAPSLREDFGAYANCVPVCGAVCPLPGFWQNDEGDQHDWLVNRGGTPTFLTGPTTDADGLAGGAFLYLESSNPCSPLKTAILTSTCILVNATGSGCDFSFDHHLYGFSIGTLRLEISANGGTDWTELLQLSGNRGNAWERSYVDLSAYDGQEVRLRLIGRTGFGSFGDMAVDNLQFYGSQVAPGVTTFYADTDGDGFGDATQPRIFCSSDLPVNFSTNSDDCNDQDATINPAATEIPCNTISESCGTMPDQNLPVFPDQLDTICSGASILLSRTPQFGGAIYWYEESEPDELLFIGSSFVPNPVLQTSDTLRMVRYLSEERTGNGCVSAARSVWTVQVQPVPDLSVAQAILPSVCAGTVVDLLATGLQDANSTAGTLRYYELDSGNEVSDNFIEVQESSGYVIERTTPFGCRDTVQVFTQLAGEVSATIDAPATTCLGQSVTLTAVAAANDASSFTYEWNDGSTSETTIFNGSQVTDTLLYSVTVTASNGCSAVAAHTLIVDDGLSNFSRSISPVSECNGSDGSITITPIGGEAPYQLSWMGAGQSGFSGTFTGSYTIENLPRGIYNIEVSDSETGNCPLMIGSNIVDGPGLIVNELSITEPACAGGLGSASISVLADNPSYLWSSGDTTAMANDLPAGTYGLTITAPDCELILDNIEVEEPAPIVALPRPAEPSCADAADGTILLQITGGTGPYEVLWNDGQNTLLASELAAGNYVATITDANGCSAATDTIALTAPPAAQITESFVNHVDCNGAATGSLGVAITGSDPSAYAFQWQDGATGPVRTELAAGIYRVTASTTAGCTATYDVVIFEPDPLESQTTQTNASCRGIADGQLGVTISGGTGPYEIVWNNGATVPQLTELAAGTYTYTITDALGCTAESEEFVIGEAEEISIGLASAAPDCVGASDGNIVAAVAGGNGGYSYLWNDGNTAPIRVGLPVGTYTLEVTDQLGCTQVDSVTLSAPQVLSTNELLRDPSCTGETDGEIVVNVNGGTPNYEFTWSNGSTTSDPGGLSAGSYQLTITDDENCRLVTDTFLLSDPALLTVDILTVDSLDCSGQPTGNIQALASGGNGDFTYLWSNGQFGPVVGELSAGSYVVSVTDGSGCFAVSETVVLAPLLPVEIELDFIQDVNAICTNAPFDSIRVRVTDGAGPFEVLWSDGVTGPLRFGLPSGEYSVTVSDANGCTASVNDIKVSETVPNLSVVVQPSMSMGAACEQGQVQLTGTIFGGVAPYQFNWSNGTSASNLTDTVLQIVVQESNQYFVQITDAVGCTATSNVVLAAIPEPLQVFAPADSVQMVACKNSPSGAIDLVVDGGVGPLEFVWTNSAGDTIAQTEDLDQLFAGTYSVAVSDAQGCTETLDVLITEPAQALTISGPAIVQDETCAGTGDGSIDVTIIGGSMPYLYFWNDPDVTQTEDLNLVSAGSYTLTVLDQNDCLYQLAPLEVRAPQPVNLLSTFSDSLLCFGDSTGSLGIQVLPDTAELTYRWFRNGDFLPTLSGSFNEGLPAGTYSIAAAYNPDCSYTFDDLVIGQPAELSVFTNTSTDADPGLNNGSASIAASGGVAPYQYFWPSLVSNEQVQNGLAPGTYEFYVRDANNCESFNSVTIGTTSSAVDLPEAMGSWTVWPTLSEGNFELSVDLLEPAPLGWTIRNLAGSLLMEENLGTQRFLQQPLDLSGFAPGMYSIGLRVGDRIYRRRVVVLR